MLAVACGAAIAVGLLTAATSPIVPAAGIAALLLVGAIWARPVLGIACFVLIVAMLPFGVIPIPLAGAQLTFVDAILIATFLAVLGRVAFGGWRLSGGRKPSFSRQPLQSPCTQRINKSLARVRRWCR